MVEIQLAGYPLCPRCGKVMRRFAFSETPDGIVDTILHDFTLRCVDSCSGSLPLNLPPQYVSALIDSRQQVRVTAAAGRQN